jgi:hypothetical protein
MMPWERFIYIDLLKAHIQEQNEKIKEQNALQRRQNRR